MITTITTRRIIVDKLIMITITMTTMTLTITTVVIPKLMQSTTYGIQNDRILFNNFEENSSDGFRVRKSRDVP